MKATVLKLVFEASLDGNVHTAYELHRKYRLTPSEIRAAFFFLKSNKIIDGELHHFQMKSELSDTQLGAIYHAIEKRELALDEKQIEHFRMKAKSRGEHYFPNMKIIDKSLKAG